MTNKEDIMIMEIQNILGRIFDKEKNIKLSKEKGIELVKFLDKFITNKNTRKGLGFYD